MAQQQPNESTEPVTGSRVAASGTERPDAKSRDCVTCRKTIGPDEPVCISNNRGRWRFAPCCLSCAEKAQRRHDRRRYDYFRTDGKEDPEWVAEYDTELPDYDPWRDWNDRACEVCSRPMRVGREEVCSHDCKSHLPALKAATRRRRMREAVTPEHFTCVKCGEEIVGTIAFWWPPGSSWGHGRDLAPWCEPCFAADRTAHHRKRRAEYDREKDIFGFGPPPDPDAKDYDPFKSIGGFEVKRCGHCGRSIRWSYSHRTTGKVASPYCSEGCQYEAQKAARRRPPKPGRTCQAPGCDEPIPPEARDDAKTCGRARCRQRIRRAKLKAKKRVTATRDRRSGSPPRNTAKRDNGKPRRGAARGAMPAKSKGKTRGSPSKGGRMAPRASKRKQTPRCTWVGGCEAPATHNVVSAPRTETGWEAVARPFASPRYCEHHAEQEARTKHCEKCNRRATHNLELGESGVHAMKSKMWASHCKTHAEAEAKEMTR